MSPKAGQMLLDSNRPVIRASPVQGRGQDSGITGAAAARGRRVQEVQMMTLKAEALAYWMCSRPEDRRAAGFQVSADRVVSL